MWLRVVPVQPRHSAGVDSAQKFGRWGTAPAQFLWYHDKCTGDAELRLCEEQFLFFLLHQGDYATFRNVRDDFFLNIGRAGPILKKTFLVGLSHTILPYICVPAFYEKWGQPSPRSHQKLWNLLPHPLQTSLSDTEWHCLQINVRGVELPRGRNLYVM